jgi:YidC/Oxa1 family membrane protein insertase
MLLTANIFQPLIDVFEAVLKFFHNSIGVPWGLSIVLLTVAIRALLIPLTYKQFSSMQKLQKLQPQLKALQNRYKDDKQRQQQEMMKFYRENQVNPLASCLPLVAQLPVFISLFYMLRKSLRGDICPQVQPGAHLVNGHWIGFSQAHTVPCGPHGGASFLFINDLTNKATGVVLVVLIVLYVGTQLISSRMMANPQMDQTQQRLIMLMPLFFVIFIINFPAGVMLYWITTNTWTMGQQYVIRRRLGMNVPVAATADGGIVEGDATDSGSNGSSSGGGGGLAGLIRSRLGSDDGAAGKSATATATRPRQAAKPPPPPRKKKKRSGRRR